MVGIHNGLPVTILQHPAIRAVCRRHGIAQILLTPNGSEIGPVMLKDLTFDITDPQKTAVYDHYLAALATDTLIDLAPALLDRAVDIEALLEVLLLGDLEAHDQFAGPGLAIDGETRGVRSAVLERAQHRGHLGPDVGPLTAMDDAGDPTHGVVAPLAARGGGHAAAPVRTPAR